MTYHPKAGLLPPPPARPDSDLPPAVRAPCLALEFWLEGLCQTPMSLAVIERTRAETITETLTQLETFKRNRRTET